MMLPYTTGLMRTNKFDAECAALADQHYSRRKSSIGSPQFMPPGKTMILRDAEGQIVFGWLHQQNRDDGQEGYNCSIFRNTSTRLSSEIIQEAEAIAWETWGPARLFTYVDRKNVKGNPGYCFKKAGWTVCGESKSRKLLLLEKHPHG